MKRSIRRRMAVAAVALAALLCTVQFASAALLELPRRQRVADAVAVLRHLHGHRTRYEGKLNLVRYNIDLTVKQLGTLDALIRSEARVPTTSIHKFLRFHDTVQELLGQLKEFGPGEYGPALERAKEALAFVRKSAEAHRPEIAKKAGEQEMKDFDGDLAEIQNEIDALQVAVDRNKGASDSKFDYEKLYRQRLAGVNKQARHYESVLAARMVEYRALFGQAVPIKTDYKSEIDRITPNEKTPGLLVID